jgi:hypothetical protein
LDLEGVYRDSMLGENEPKEASDSDAKYTLERVQVDIVLATSLENDG